MKTIYTCNVLEVTSFDLPSLIERLFYGITYPMYLKSKPNIVSFKSALKAKSDILDKITFNGLQGINKDIVNYIY